MVEDEDRVVTVAHWGVSAAVCLTARDRDPSRGLDATLREDGLTADGVLDIHSLVSNIISVELKFASGAVEPEDHGGLLNEQTAVHWAVVAGDHYVRGHNSRLGTNSK